MLLGILGVMTLAGCDVIDDLVDPFLGQGPQPTAALVPDFIAQDGMALPNDSQDASIADLRRQAAAALGVLQVPSGEPWKSIKGMGQRVLAEEGLLIAQGRLEDGALLQHDVALLTRLLDILSQPSVSQPVQEALFEAFSSLLRADYRLVKNAAADAQVLALSAVSAGDAISEVGVQAATAEQARTEQAMEALDDALSRGDVRAALELFIPTWESAAAVRGVWGLKYDQDYDEDGVTLLDELANGASPFVEDSDGDGLTDRYELENTYPQTSPGLADSDGDGVLDGDEDLDLDGVINSIERDLGTNPLVLDSDGDGLGDLAAVLGDEMGAMTGDSDGDGLSDESEARLGTDPHHVDSDGDGVPDGQEFHVQEISVPELGLRVQLLGLGDHSLTFHAEQMIGAPGFAGNFGQVGNFVAISTELPFQTALIFLTYDETLVPGGDEENLRLFRYDESKGTMVMLADQIVDTEANDIQGHTDQFGPIGALYLPIWQAVNPQQ